MDMRYTGRRVCCALLSAVLIIGGLPGSTGAAGLPGRMTAWAAVGSRKSHSVRSGKGHSVRGREGHPVNSHEGGGHDAFPNSDGRDV